MAPTPILLSPSRAKAAGITLAPDESAFRENSATIVMPSAEAAFLNPVQEFNRDLSILAITTWSQRLDAEKKNRFQQSQNRNRNKQAKLKRKAQPNAPREHTNGEGSKKVKVQHHLHPQQSDSTDATSTGAAESSLQPLQTDPSNKDPASLATPDEIDSASVDAVYKPYKFTLLEALSATGLRSIRYAKEIPLLKWVMANDLSPTAVEAMKRNVALNFPPDRPIDEWIASEATPAETESDDASAELAVDEDALMELENQARAKALSAAAGAGAASHTAASTQSPASETASLTNGSTAAPSAPAKAAVAETPAAGKDSAVKASSSTDSNLIHPDCKIKLNAGDAITLMYTHREPAKRFDVVDLDPYGSASPFLDGGVQSVADGGLLCVTCTDLAVLAGHNYPEKCFSQYGGVSVKAEFSHEVALRLVLHTIATSAARYGRYIQPLLSLSIDFYMRTFVRVWTGPVEVKKNASRTGTVYVCSQCQNWSVQRMGRATRTDNVGKTGQASVNWRYQSAQGPPVDGACGECGGRMHLGGPMWFGPLHDASFCEALLHNLDARPLHAFHTAPRIRGMVSLAARELAEHPFYFTPPKVSGLFHCVSPPLDKVVAALISAGYGVSRSHAVAGSLKTDATRAQVYDVLRAWVRRNPVRMDKVKPGEPAHRLLAKEPTREYDFDATDDERVRAVLGEKMVRYQANPQANWGPGTAAKGHKAKKKRNARPDDLEQSKD